jgi:hypothetical protein
MRSKLALHQTLFFLCALCVLCGYHFFMMNHPWVMVQFELSEYENSVHHRDTEDTEVAQRVEYRSSLCASSVSSVSLW